MPTHTLRTACRVRLAGIVAAVGCALLGNHHSVADEAWPPPILPDAEAEAVQFASHEDSISVPPQRDWPDDESEVHTVAYSNDGGSWTDGMIGWVNVGYMSLDVPVGGEDAFNYAFGGAAPLIGDRFYGFGVFDVAHDASTQMTSSVGLQWAPDVWSDSAFDRFCFAAAAQNYDDSRFGNCNLWRYVVDCSYAVMPGLIVGAYHNAPLGGADVNFTPGAPVPFIENIHMSRCTLGYVTRYVGPLSLSFRAGYGDRPNSWRVGGSANLIVTENVSLFFSSDGHKEDQWAAFAGVQFALGPKPYNSQQRSGDVVRGGEFFAYKAAAKSYAINPRDQRDADYRVLYSWLHTPTIDSFTRSP